MHQIWEEDVEKEITKEEILNRNLRVWARRFGLLNVTPISLPQALILVPGIDPVSRAVPMVLIAMLVIKERHPQLDKGLQKWAAWVVGVTAKLMVYNDMDFKTAADKIQMSDQQRRELTDHFVWMKELVLEFVERRKKEYQDHPMSALRKQIENDSPMDWDA